MTLKDKINEDLKTAMKSGDKVRLETIRSIRALILEFEKSGAGREINADDELKMLTSAVKKRKDAIEQYTNANRPELAAKEEAELATIMEYLPKQLTPDELLQEVMRIAAAANAVTKADFNKVIGPAMKQLKGRADGQAIKLAVEQVLGS